MNKRDLLLTLRRSEYIFEKVVSLWGLAWTLRLQAGLLPHPWVPEDPDVTSHQSAGEMRLWRP